MHNKQKMKPREKENKSWTLWLLNGFSSTLELTETSPVCKKKKNAVFNTFRNVIIIKGTRLFFLFGFLVFSKIHKYQDLKETIYLLCTGVGPGKGNLTKIKWDKNYLTKMAPHSHYLNQKPKIKIQSNGWQVPEHKSKYTKHKSEVTVWITTQADKSFAMGKRWKIVRSWDWIKISKRNNPKNCICGHLECVTIFHHIICRFFFFFL